MQLTAEALTRLTSQIVTPDSGDGTALFTLNERLHPGGPTAGRIAEPAWPRLSTWDSLESAVQAGGPGTVAFIRAGDPGVAALVLYHTSDAGLRYVGPATGAGPGVSVTAAGRVGSAGGAQALVFSPVGEEIPVRPETVHDLTAELGNAEEALRAQRRELSDLMQLRDIDAERVVALTERLPRSQARVLAAQSAPPAPSPSANLLDLRAEALVLARQLRAARHELANHTERIDELKSLIQGGAERVAQLRAGVERAAAPLNPAPATVAAAHPTEVEPVVEHQHPRNDAGGEARGEAALPPIRWEPFGQTPRHG